MLQLARARRQARKNTLLTEGQIMHDFQLYVWVLPGHVRRRSRQQLSRGGSSGRTQLLNDCWNNYRDVYALPLNAVVLGDVHNFRPTIVQLKMACVRLESCEDNSDHEMEIVDVDWLCESYYFY
jgi:hypothetical protein